jgi:hypothetical protein
LPRHVAEERPAVVQHFLMVARAYSAEVDHEIKIEDQWVRVDPGTILPLSSPDGPTHACFSRYRWIDPPSKTFINLRRVILGGMA